jgi:hypothetical protein
MPISICSSTVSATAMGARAGITCNQGLFGHGSAVIVTRWAGRACCREFSRARGEIRARPIHPPEAPALRPDRRGGRAAAGRGGIREPMGPSPRP